MTGKFATLSRLPVTIASALFSTSPFFAALFAFFALGEALSLVEGFALAMTCLGAVLIGYFTVDDAFASTQQTNVEGVTLGILTASIIGSVFVIVRWTGEKVHFLLSVFAVSIGCMMIAMGLSVASDGIQGVTNLLRCGRLLGHKDMGALWMVGMLAFMGISCLNRGLQLTKAGRAAVLRTSDIPINFALGYILLGETRVAREQVWGCILVLGGTCYVSMKQGK